VKLACAIDDLVFRLKRGVEKHSFLERLKLLGLNMQKAKYSQTKDCDLTNFNIEVFSVFEVHQLWAG
jgi:hypothetical protein